MVKMFFRVGNFGAFENIQIFEVYNFSAVIV